MSKEFRDKHGLEMDRFTSDEMRLHCQRPGKHDDEGNPIYTTEQHHKRECDINYIIEKYDKTGIITHIKEFEGEFGDLSGLDFKTMQDQVAHAKSMFQNLPWKIRERFKNNPQYLLSFMENAENRQEAIKLGLIANNTPEDLDGLGEHVKNNKKIEKTENTETTQ